MRRFSLKLTLGFFVHQKDTSLGTPHNYPIFFFIFKEARRIFRTYKKKPVQLRRPSPKGVVFVSRLTVLEAQVLLPGSFDLYQT